MTTLRVKDAKVTESTVWVQPKADVHPWRRLTLPLCFSLVVVMSISLMIFFVGTMNLINYLASASYSISLGTFEEAIPNNNTETTGPLDIVEFCAEINDTCTVRTIQLDEGVFTEIWAVVTSTYSRIDFSVRHNTLKIGDLMGIWGKPNINQFSDSLKLYWGNGSVFAEATSPTGQFSYFLPVTRVVITGS